jgi:DNA-binding NtrC family response regulator
MSDPASPSPADPSAAPSERCARVLVVEDDLPVLEMAVQLLAADGHGVAAARSAEEALEIVAADHVDVVFCDVMLPGASGLDLAAELQRATPHLPVILTSGQRTPDVREAIERTGLRFVAKPYTSQEVRSAVAAALSSELAP